MPSNVTVVGPLEVECKGMTDNPRPLAFDGSSACGTPELTYWAASAENQAQDVGVSACTCVCAYVCPTEGLCFMFLCFMFLSGGVRHLSTTDLIDG